MTQLVSRASSALEPEPQQLQTLQSPYWTSTAHVLVKRFMDLAFSLILIVATLPIMLVLAIAIKVDSRGPALYNWDVVGKNGIPFRSWKLRSMCIGADSMKAELFARNEMRGPVFKLENDPRVTRVGKFLRRYSLDELPQLFSVLRGDVSLVGPRPPLQSEYVFFSDYQKQKLSVKPGITCLWQVSGRNEIQDFDEWVKLDLEYIRTWSLWLDCKILLSTVATVLGGTGR
jgi:lipopolysaccharide/colanic/teichoic acid biosynthesis glycosyltransferase